ncbi:hypothetical protein BC939DRAFT_452127 [Gamsiella multidivaricata]|uniref:uncharacterized protein n=1 Tax=Gamsiella multidivaricata TaxID=101098 RepID=UPI00221F4AD5|nr:uncharacterized protein BC939DRAFT_452127 [Gamsiella multidivaricata]KAI7823205.1 hypothetical protein BC939DRAFT_452127 [Gamsiella multidivaricata]
MPDDNAPVVYRPPTNNPQIAPPSYSSVMAVPPLSAGGAPQYVAQGQGQQPPSQTVHSKNPQSLPSPEYRDPRSAFTAHYLPQQQQQPQHQAFAQAIAAKQQQAQNLTLVPMLVPAPAPVVYRPATHAAPGLHVAPSVSHATIPHQHQRQHQHQHQHHQQPYQPQPQYPPQHVQQHPQPQQHPSQPQPQQQHYQPYQQHVVHHTVRPAPVTTTVYARPTQQFQPMHVQIPAQVPVQVAPRPVYLQPALAPAPAPTPGLVVHYKCQQCGAQLPSANAPCRKIHATRTTQIQTMTGPAYGSGGTKRYSTISPGSSNGSVMITTVGPPVLISSPLQQQAPPPVLVATQSQSVLVSPPPLQIATASSQHISQPQVVFVQTSSYPQTSVLASPPPTPENNYGTDAVYYNNANKLYGSFGRILSQQVQHTQYHHYHPHQRPPHHHTTHHHHHHHQGNQDNSSDGESDAQSYFEMLQQQQDGGGGGSGGEGLDQSGDWLSQAGLSSGLDNGSSSLDFTSVDASSVDFTSIDAGYIDFSSFGGGDFSM